MKIIDGRSRKLGGLLDVLLVTDLDYLNETIDKIGRSWNMFWSSYNEEDISAGRSSCERKTIPIGSFGLYLGSLNVYDPCFYGTKKLKVCRAILLEKSVYIVPANRVKWVQGVIKPKKVANDG